MDWWRDAGGIGMARRFLSDGLQRGQSWAPALRTVAGCLDNVADNEDWSSSEAEDWENRDVHEVARLVAAVLRDAAGLLESWRGED